MENEIIFYYLAAVPVVGIMAQWLAWRFRLPSILLLLAFGIGLGHLMEPYAHGEDIIPTEFLFPIVSLSVAVILFEGGLTLRLNELKESGRTVFRLVSVGAVITAILTAVAVHYIFDLDARMAALIGAILVVTGPTVVAPLLRHIRPTRRVASMVKWEGIVIDPVGAILAVLVFDFLVSSGMREAAWTTILVLGKTIAYGGVIGVVGGAALVLLAKRFWIPDFLHSPVFLAVALAAFALTNYLQREAGLVTVTVMGVFLANQKLVPVRHVIEFKENLQVLLIASLFVILGSRIDLMSIVDLGMNGVLFLVVLVFVIRPLAVLGSTIGTDVTWRQRVFLSFLAPRGIVAAAVASVFAFELGHHQGLPPELAQQATQLVPLTFLTIISTVTVYGLLAAPLANWLKLSESDPQGVLFAGADRWVQDIALVLKESQFPVVLVDTNFANVSSARMKGLPAHCASIIGEFVHEEMDLGGLGQMLAMTPNDELNALAARECVHMFGRRRVYQLYSTEVGSGRRQSLSQHVPGRLLFGEGVDHKELVRRFQRGDIVKRTAITEEFTFDDFREMYGEDAIVLFVIDDDELKASSAESPVRPKPGQSVIALVRPLPKGEVEA